jgi:lysophospholipase L1-like esterase
MAGSLRKAAWGLGLFAASLCAHGQPTGTAEQAQRARLDASIARWQGSLDDFAAADRQQAPTTGGVVFVGSSSIRLWDKLETQFGEPVKIVKRGFGGSRLSDCATLAQRLVIPYEPRLVVVYAGDNDLAEGATPQEVLASFASFVEGVRAKLPATRIAYVSIKPSPARLGLMPKIRETNQLLAAFTAGHDNLDYIDIFTPMLDANGQPRRALFRADALHLNDDGYALWRGVIAGHLGSSTLASAATQITAAVPPAAAAPTVHVSETPGGPSLR